jgi:hypothetical protein
MSLYVTDPLKLLKCKPVCFCKHCAGRPLQFGPRTFSVRTRSRGVSIEPDGVRIATRITKKRVSCDGRAQSRAWLSFGLEGPNVGFLSRAANLFQKQTE